MPHVPNLDDLKSMAQLTSTVVALVALYISFRGERRNQARFQQQLDLSLRVAQANVRPLLALTISAYVNHKAIELSNHGAGTAVIRKITAHRGRRSVTSVIELIELNRDITWDDFTEYGGSTEYLQPKASDTLIELTEDRLTSQGVSKRDALALLEDLEKQIDEIKIFATYEDVLGNVIAEDEQIV